MRIVIILCLMSFGYIGASGQNLLMLDTVLSFVNPHSGITSSDTISFIIISSRKIEFKKNRLNIDKFEKFIFIGIKGRYSDVAILAKDLKGRGEKFSINGDMVLNNVYVFNFRKLKKYFIKSKILALKYFHNGRRISLGLSFNNKL